MLTGKNNSPANMLCLPIFSVCSNFHSLAQKCRVTGKQTKWVCRIMQQHMFCDGLKIRASFCDGQPPIFIFQLGFLFRLIFSVLLFGFNFDFFLNLILLFKI